MFRLKLIGGLIVLVLITAVVRYVDRKLNYVTSTASVTSVKAECYLYREDFWLVVGTKETSDEMPCPKAESLASGHPEYQGMFVKGVVDVSFKYVSPADNVIHGGRMSFPYEERKWATSLKSGNEFPLLVHKTDAQLYVRDGDDLDSPALAKS
jgi:hypothetical protein